MDFQIREKLFVVTGATSGMGLAITQGLINEGSQVIVNARTEEHLLELKKQHGDQIQILHGDITTDATIANLFRLIGSRRLDGIVINAGGPPTKSFLESEISDWDQAYASVLRWKIKLTYELLDKLRPQQYGRIVYLESMSVKQPVENLILSNSLRLAVVGFVKTLSQELAIDGITANIIAPGYHDTPAMERLYGKKAMLLGISPFDAKTMFEKESLMGRLGNPSDLAVLALWLLSPFSSYVTGQTISVDGGLIKGIMG
jgi:3-oxoacyl-[acyl-carrier protein] reductase